MSSEKHTEPGYLKRMLAKAETEPLPFAFGVAATPESCLLTIHPTKSAKALGESLKKESGIKKAAYGSISAEGKLLIMDLEKKVPALGKMVKKYLASQPLKQSKVSVRFNGKDITDEEDDGSGAEDSAGAPTPAAAPAATTSAPGLAVSPATFSKTALIWDKTMQSAKKEIKDFQKAVLTQMKDNADLKKLAQALHQIDDALTVFDGKLQKILTKGAQVTSPEQQNACRTMAVDLLNGYLGMIKRDPILMNLGKNPFAKVTIDKTLETSIRVLLKSLSA